MFNFNFAPAIPESDRELLQATFLDVWMSLPTDAKASMIANWSRADGPKIPTVDFQFKIEGQQETVSAICMTFGDGFQYLYPRIVTMPVDIRRTLLAHELAHSYDWSRPEAFEEIKAPVGLQFKGTWFDYATKRAVWTDARRGEHEREFEGYFLFSQEALNMMDLSIENHARMTNSQTFRFDEDKLQVWLEANVKASEAVRVKA